MHSNWRIPAVLLAATLAAAAVAESAHHPPGGASGPPIDQGGVTAGAMPSDAGMMGGAGMTRDMHGGMMRHMREMMAHMHGAPATQMGAMNHGSDSSMPGLESLSGEEFEVAFMSMMTAHHQGAIDMADWVLERGDDPDVLAAAQSIKDAQDPEIEQMAAWLREWYDSDVDATWAGMMNADMSGMVDAMGRGSDPDLAFLAEMIRHHQGAIDMAQVALERAEHQELRDMARDIVVAQAEEVHQYQTWLEQAAE
ncbi:MAG TPA: DUF305 domain-containing protein [Trueperaceae bacterium]|nr:DUF305 domain-containing protein [Trueperaceae bacterium]